MCSSVTSDYANRRRSTRVLFKVSLLICGMDAQGRAFETPAETILVNKHGAKVRTERKLVLGGEVMVVVPKTARRRWAMVVWEGTRKTKEYAFGLSHPENLWGVPFPPADWHEKGGLPSVEHEAVPAAAMERNGKSDNPRQEVSRRREERIPATGRVIVRSGETVIHGNVVDMSHSGFRIRYRGEPVAIGPEADVSFLWGRVEARTVWFRRSRGWVELGFKVTGQAETESLPKMPARVKLSEQN